MNYPNTDDLYEGKFTDGDPIAGIAPSVDSAEHMNAVYDELIAAITGAGIEPDSSNQEQLLDAINYYRNASNMIAGTVPLERLPVTQSAKDNSVDRLMKNGDHGNGTVEAGDIVDDFETLDISALANGERLIATSSTLNQPTGLAAESIITVTKYSAAKGSIDINYYSIGRKFTRNYTSVWSSFIETTATIGVDQAYQNVITSRAVNVIYTNTTDKPIFVAIDGSLNQGLVAVRVDGFQVGAITDHGGITKRSQVSFIVPVGSVYSVDYAADVTIESWVELR